MSKYPPLAIVISLIMDQWEEKLVKSDVSNISNKPAARDILVELRNMNNNYVEFFTFMMGEFKKLTNGETEREQKLEDLKTKMEEKHETYDTQFASMENRLKVLEENDRVREEKLVELECRSRKLNLIFPKLEEKPLGRLRNQRQDEESYDEVHGKVVRFLTEKMGILNAHQMLFRNIHRLGKRNPTHKSPRNVIAAFVHQPDVDYILQRAREMKDNSIHIRTDLPKKYNDIRNALLKIRSEYRNRPTPIKCKLTYIKFKPTLFKLIGGTDVQVELETGPDGEYREKLPVVELDH